ncbi:vacuolar protein sorting-associated protein 54, chloroplastic-like isoform X2 [Brassica napus]|uniref:vacuolar protein sorting-associated protein 54, chloroplastic isoform X2 n=1 Tax=Brassica oleracea var. oleracea TaxID=109376 RepID=UPI0006A747A0|nr:PREDICTED: vacuolar protein sorting-associated protein 54, chloroplastic isoform X2 [Brassica oleracea var. oleracea]XP_048628571.1 vacuolar protein sorting-associated protein 54, chloroplastic-like isoform X2 [Brassica napus]
MDSHPSLTGRSIGNSNRSSLDLGHSSSSSHSSLTKSISDASSQSLSSILNNPHVGKSGVYGTDASWVGWWSSSSTSVSPSEFSPVASAKLPGSDLTRSDFNTYISSISDSHNRFEDIINHTKEEESSELDQERHVSGLASCLREVPSLYFKEDFALEDGATFRSACPFSSLNENLALQEKLSQYLDVVEMHLVKEISVRSDSFFEAQGQLEDLNVKIVEGCRRIRDLKETIRVIDRSLVDSARRIQELSSTRVNMLELQRKLRVILYVNQALTALKLFVASADCAGALDITDDLQNLLAGDELTGLHCFRHLRDHVTISIDSINSILTAEFMRISIHNTGEIDVLILSSAKKRGSISSNGETGDEVKLEEEDTSTLCDRLLPLVIGLLRTAKFPSILRMYREALTSEMKNAIKNAVAELLPILVARSLESDFSHGERSVDVDGGGLSLASKLRTLSSEAFVNLLTAIFRIVQAHLVRASEVKKAIEWILCNIDGHYAADSVAAAIAVGAVAAESAQESGFQSGQLVSSPLGSLTSKTPSLQRKSSDATNLMNMSRNFRADVLRENTEAVFAACEVTHARWAKLLGVRALLHPKLKLQEFMSIYDLTQEFITVTEKIGGRLGSSIRGTLQSQAKAFVDSQHEARMTKLKAVLDQETWDEIDVPEEFQSIISSLFASQELISGKGTEDQSTESRNEKSESSEGAAVSNAQVKSTVKASVSSVTNNQSNQKAHGKSNLFYQGVGYHMVNCGLILLKMLSEYIDMNNSLPALSSEIVLRVVEVLRFFNTRTCQLVLGAGAMQVSGLKSIKAKHLALASQVIDFTYTIIPESRRIMFSKVPEARKPLLSVDIDKVAQDYRVHRDEIYTKLVQIMRERLLAHLHGLPKVVEGWNRPPDTNKQTKEFAWPLTREVGYLHRVLSETLHEADVQAIFRQVILIIHTQTSQTLANLEISSPEAKKRLKLHVELILKCIRSLPSDNTNQPGIPNWGQLDEFFAQHFREEEEEEGGGQAE